MICGATSKGAISDPVRCQQHVCLAAQRVSEVSDLEYHVPRERGRAMLVSVYGGQHSSPSGEMYAVASDIECPPCGGSCSAIEGLDAHPVHAGREPIDPVHSLGAHISCVIYIQRAVASLHVLIGYLVAARRDNVEIDVGRLIP